MPRQAFAKPAVQVGFETGLPGSWGLSSVEFSSQDTHRQQRAWQSGVCILSAGEAKVDRWTDRQLELSVLPAYLISSKIKDQ